MISYEPLFRTMKNKGVTSYRLAKMGFPMSNYHAMRNGKYISTHTLDTLCNILDCEITDVMVFQKNEAEMSNEE